MAEAVVLCGGYSSRIGKNKMMLELGGHPLIWHTVAGLSHVTSRIIIVTGHYHEEIFDLFSDRDNCLVVHNADYPQGMFTSVKRGVREVISDFFILPGDYPLIREETYRLLLNGTKDVRVPVMNGRGGHPVFFSYRLKEMLLEEPDDSNLKIFRDRHDIEFIETGDEGVVTDVDTLKDFSNIEDYYKKG